MFIESPKGTARWNLHSLVAYQPDEKSDAITLIFPLAVAGNVKITSKHPQYRQIVEFLRASTLGPDAAA